MHNVITDNCNKVRPKYQLTTVQMWELKTVSEMTTTHLHTSWKTSMPLTHSCSNDGMIQLGPLSSDAMFEVVEISDACFVHLLLQDVPHAVVFQLVWRWVLVTSSTAFNSDIRTVVSWYSSLIFLHLSVMTLCVSIYDDHLIHKVKQWHWLGVVDFCCVNLVSHYLNDIPCKNYNYTFVFVKVVPKTLLVPFFSGHGVEYLCIYTTCGRRYK